MGEGRSKNFSFRRDWWSILALAAYDLWLLAFPLQGYFFLKINGPKNFSWFIIPHTTGFFLAAWFGHRINFRKVSLWAGVLTSLLTMFYPFLPYLQNYLLAFIGVASAFLIVRIGCLLRCTRDPVISSALGLALGNVLLGITLWIDPPKEVLFPLLGIFLLSQVPASFYPQRQEPLKDLLRYLPFIFVFYLLIGTFYVCLMPFYVKYCYFSGSELLFYIGAVLSSAYLFRKKADYSLVVGVGMGIFAVSFLHSFTRLTSNLAMYAVQAAAGFIDIFCFGLFIRGQDVIRRFGFGAGTMLAGPMVGLPVLYTKQWPMLLCIGGNIVLGLGLLLFYFVQTAVRGKEKASVLPNIDEVRLAETCRTLGTPRELFSYREWEILKLILSGKTIREIASLLNLSESSVKTYLQRVYRKLGVSSKRELLQKILG